MTLKALKRYVALIHWRIRREVACQIPRRFYPKVKFPHPVGIVIGDGVRIGEGVRIYQNVTVGLLENVDAAEPVGKYPTIGNEVIIYAGAVVAGAITIGDGAVIGANAVITKDVPARMIAFGRNQIKAANPLR